MVDRSRRTGKPIVRKRVSAIDKVLASQPEKVKKLLSGEMSVRELTDGEVEKGKLLGPGGLYGNPVFIPVKVVEMMHAEYLRRVRLENLPATAEAYKALRHILTSERTNPLARVQAAREILDRLEGKVTDTVQIQAEIHTWEKTAGEIVVDLDHVVGADSGVIDADLEE